MSNRNIDNAIGYSYTIDHATSYDNAIESGFFVFSQQLPEDSTAEFTCELLDATGTSLGVLTAATGTVASNPVRIDSLPGDKLTAKLNWENSGQPEVEIPLDLSDKGGLPALNHLNLQFSWAPSPASNGANVQAAAVLDVLDSKSYLTGFDEHGQYGFLSYIPWMNWHYISGQPPTQNGEHYLSGQYSCQFNEGLLGQSYLDTKELTVPPGSTHVLTSFAFLLLKNPGSTPNLMEVVFYEDGTERHTTSIGLTGRTAINGWYNFNINYVLQSSSTTKEKIYWNLRSTGNLGGILTMDNLAVNFMAAAPTPVQKTILYTDLAGKVCGIDRLNGDQEWEYVSEYGNLDSSVAINNSIAYLGDGDTQANVYALNTAQGQSLWKTPVPGSIDTAPVICNELLMVASSNGRLYALSLDNGQVQWDVAYGPGTHATPNYVNGLTAYGIYIYLATQDGIYASNVAAKQDLWYHASASVPFSPVVTADYVVFAANDGTLACLNRSDGTPVWRINVNAPVNSQPYVVGGIAVIGTDDGRLLGYSMSDGSQKWEKSFPGTMIRSFIVDGRYIYVAANEISGKSYCLLYSIDNNGDWSFNELWSSPLPIGAQCPPSIEGDLVFWSASNSRLYAMEKVGGQTSWQYTSGSQGFATPTPLYQQPNIPLSRRYDQSCFIVAHNAFANIDNGWYYAQQTHSITKQLDMGARGLELDIYLKMINGAQQIVYDHAGINDWQVYFGGQWMLLKDSLGEIKDWLDRNNKEVVTIIFEQGPGLGNPNTLLTQAFTESLIAPYVFYANQTNTGSTGSTWNVGTQGWPTLQWMVDNGKRLVVFSQSRPSSVTGFPRLWDYAVENQYGTPSLLSGCEKRSESDPLTDNAGKLLVMNYAFNMPTLPTTIQLPSTYSLVNNYYWVLGKVRACQDVSGNNRLPNLLKLNFFEYGSFGGPLAVAQQINQELENPI